MNVAMFGINKTTKAIKSNLDGYIGLAPGNNSTNFMG